MRILRWTAAAVLTAAAAGCAARVAPRPAAMPPAREVLDRLAARTPARAFRALVGIEVRFGGGRAGALFRRETGVEEGAFGGRAVLLWQAPASLRLEPLSPLGSPLFVLVARGGELRLFSPARGRLYVGGADAQSMARLLGVPLESGLMVRILQGALPVVSPEGARAARLDWDAGAGRLRLEIPPGGGMERRQVVWLAFPAMSLRRVRLGEPGAQVEVAYGPFRKAAGGWLPGWVEISGPKGENRLRIDLSGAGEGAAGGELPPGLFDLPAPPGIRVVPLDEGGER